MLLATQFRAVGLDIADVMGLTKQALEGGAPNVDKAVDALKEFAIRAKDGTETTMNAFDALGLDAKQTAEDIAAGGPKAREAMDEVLDRIRDIPNAYDQGLVAAALFGTQWEDLQAAFNNLDLDRAKAEIGDFTGATDEAMRTSTDNAAAEWEEAGRRIEQTFANLRSKMANWFDFIPQTINDLFTPGGIFSDDAPPVNDPANTGPMILPPTTGPSGPPSGVPQLAPGLSIPGVTVAQDPLAALNPGGGGQGVGLNLQIANAPIRNSPPLNAGMGSSTAPSEDQVKQIAARFGLVVTSEDRPGDSGYHGQGLALDIGMPGGGDKTPQMQAFAEYMSSTFGPNLLELIYDAPGWAGNIKDGKVTGAFGNVYTMGQAGYHGDHVHVAANWGNASAPAIAASTSRSTSSSSLWDEIAKYESGNDWSNNNSGGHSTSSGAPRGGLQITDGTWQAFGGTEFAPTANLATKEQQIAVAERIAFTGYKGTPPQGLGAWEVITQGKTPNITTSTPQSAFMSSSGPTSSSLNNAFGPGYQPGIGTPGYNEYGEPGYYETDPRRIAQAERSAADTQRRIGQADEAIQDINEQITELQAERDRVAAMSEIERTVAKVDLDKIESDLDRLQDRKAEAELGAQRAREDAQWAQEDLAEANKGSFRAAREAPKSSSSRTGQQGTSALGEIGSIAGSFLNETFGFGSWLPDLTQLFPVQAADTILGFAVDQMLAQQQAATTSGGQFGMPDIAPPPAPGTPASGAGLGPAPGPVQNVTIDQSIHGNVGWDPAEAERRRKQDLARAIPRIPMGS